MKDNPVIETMLSRKSIRRYKGEVPSDQIITTIVQAGQQAPFALLLSRNKENHPYEAPLMFTICIDSYKFELIMAKRNWNKIMNDLFLLILGIQDASLLSENMVIAAESLGLGSCFIGDTPYYANKIIQNYKLPKRVFPLVQLVMGYPAEDPPIRPRYPLNFTLFESEYPRLEEDVIMNAMRVMDEGFLNQDYYQRRKAKILTFDKIHKDKISDLVQR